MKRRKIIIIGATSGIGYETAKIFQQSGWIVGLAGRRIEPLEELKLRKPARTHIRSIDITSEEAEQELAILIDETGGMDVFFLCAGIGSQNLQLNPETELNTIGTNVYGFTRMMIAAYHFFEDHGQKGHIAAITSIAGTKGLGAAPAYSATKGFQNLYLDALEQLAYKQKLKISFTDIRPGFVNTDLLKNGNYPMLMQPDKVARTIFHAITSKKRKKIIDWRYAVLVFFWRMIPTWIWKRFNAFN